MSFSEEDHHKNIYIDESLLNETSYILSSFEGINKLLKENFYFFFLTENKTNTVNENIETIFSKHNLTEKEDLEVLENLKKNLSTSLTSFSFGRKDVEFVFIIFTEDNPAFLSNPPALIGLLIHEILHGIERQRGLEDDLKRSLTISLETFQNFAKMVSSSKFNEKDLIDLFESIGETAVFVLKDLYVDREAIERGYGTEILEQYKATFNLHDELISDNLPEITLDLDQIDPNNIDLEEFKVAFLVLLGLIPTWLTFIRISKGYERDQALELRGFIDKTYKKVSIISERFHHLENTYLTEFNFTKSFHTRWFSEIFSIVIDLLSGGEFIIWQFSRFVIDLEKYLDEVKSENPNANLYQLQDLILVPVLKSAFLFSKEHTKLKSINEEIDEKLRSYISEEDIQEWEGSYQEFFIEDLLLFVLNELVQLLREKFLDSIQNLRVYTGFVLSTLQILIDIKDVKNLEQYHIFKNLIHQFIVNRDSRFLSLKILYPMECEIEQLMFSKEPPFTPEEAEEFLQIGRFYSLPKLNWVLEIAKKIAGIVKLAIRKANERDEGVSPDVVAMTMLVVTKSSEEVENPELLIPIARSTLIAIKFSMNLMKESVKMYGDLLESK